MMRLQLALGVIATMFVRTSAHGSMINPAPRQAHNQAYDSKNQCGCEKTPGGCYSNSTSPGDYCGIGCLGDACLYYQIGCFQNCPTCSLVGKSLYPVPADLVAAGNCPVPPTPTLGGGDPVLEKQLRTYNIDNASHVGDWTKWNPWRAPGTAGKGNPAFQPCGINSGSAPSFPDPPAKGQAKSAPGSALPALPRARWSTYQAGSVQEMEFAIYANHGGGYSYRLCKNDGNPMTEECYQQTPLDFATDESTVHYWDGSKPDFQFQATTTKVGTYPAHSMWRKNPIPMCNCDIGTKCGSAHYTDADAARADSKEVSDSEFSELVTAKGCTAVPLDKCGQKGGFDTCLKCGSASAYDCEVCCPNTTHVSKAGYEWCKPTNPAPNTCDPIANPRGCFGIPYPQSYLAPGQLVAECSTGLQFPTAKGFPDGAGAGIGGVFKWSIRDKVQIPPNLTAGQYSISWRWDCEQTPQVWNSCADVLITV